MATCCSKVPNERRMFLKIPPVLVKNGFIDLTKMISEVYQKSLNFLKLVLCSVAFLFVFDLIKKKFPKLLLTLQRKSSLHQTKKIFGPPFYSTPRHFRPFLEPYVLLPYGIAGHSYGKQQNKLTSKEKEDCTDEDGGFDRIALTHGHRHTNQMNQTGNHGNDQCNDDNVLV